MPAAALLLLLHAFCFGEAALALTMPDVTIIPEGGMLFAPGHVFNVQARLRNSTGIQTARCYFRYADSVDYLYVDLHRLDGDLYQARLPAPARDVDSVQYFFLVVNKARQVVRSKVHLLRRAGGPILPAHAGSPVQAVEVKTELPTVPEEVKTTLYFPRRVALDRVDADQRFGLTAGLYRAEDFPDQELSRGYFGGFVADGNGGFVPVEGAVPALRHVDGATGSAEQEAPDAAAGGEVQLQTETGIVGPDLEGDTWKGVFYRRTYEDPDPLPFTLVSITAEVAQSAYTAETDFVTITTSRTGLGFLFHGTVTADGHMLLYDMYDGEDWTTLFGPATETSIVIADYLVMGPEDTRPDLNVIELYREPYTPPSPPSFLPALYKLILH